MSSQARAVADLAMLAAVLIVTAAPSPIAAAGTPAEMVDTYNALADAILATKHTEENLVRSILAAAFAHAQVEMSRAEKALQAKDAKATEAAIENLADDVAQLGNEGDNKVAAVRKRLLEGGHHHHASGEAEGLYEEGYVVVTRAAKQSLLERSRTIAGMARGGKAEALAAEWAKVQATYAELMKK
jgi:hypothetical protein